MRARVESPIALYRNAFLLYNPVAGKFRRHGGTLLPRLLAALQAAGHQVTVRPTTGPKMAGDLAQSCVRDGADLVLIAGGDGTVNEAANGMIGSTVPIGVLPAGTANVLAVETGIGTRTEKAAASLANWVPERISVGRLVASPQQEVRYFLLMAGIGLDAHIVYHLNSSVKARWGKLAYWLGGLQQLGRTFADFQVTSTQPVTRASFAIASRVRNYGGDLAITRQAHLCRPELELVLFEGRNSWRYSQYLLAVLAGLHTRLAGVHSLHTTRATFTHPSSEQVYVQIDGEYAGRLPATVDVVPDALTLLVPRSYRSRLSPPGRGHG